MPKPFATIRINADNFEKNGDIEPEDITIWHSFKGALGHQSIIDQCKYAIDKIAPIVLKCEEKFYRDDGSIGSLTIEVED